MIRAARPTCFTVLIALCIFLTHGSARAANVVTLLPIEGTPDTAVRLSGTGFGAGEAVDVYVDTVDTLLLVASSSGTISGSVTIPPSAGPGSHDVTAVGRRTSDAAQAVFTVTTPWTEFGFGVAHLNDNPWENTLASYNIASAGTLWTHVEPVGTGGATPAVVGGVVYVSLLAGVEALSAGTGATLWKVGTSSTYYASPTVLNGIVYIGNASGSMYALSAATGAKIWGTTLGSAIFSSAVVSGGLVYVTSGDSLYALNVATGKVTWTFASKGRIDGSATVVDGVVYVGSNDDSVYALNALTGAPIWTYATGGEIEQVPAVVNGIVYVGSDDGNMYALQARGSATGTLLWKAATGGIFGSAAVANNLVYVGAAGGTMYALDARTGTVVWTVGTGGIIRTLATADGVVYFTSQDNTFYAVDAYEGTILATEQTGSSFFGGPSVSDGVIYLSVYGGNTYAFSLAANVNPSVRRGPPAPSSLHPNLSLPATR